MTRSIVTRWAPDGTLKQEVLISTAPEEWGGDRERAHVFDTHGEADTWAQTHPFTDYRQRSLHGWAIVLGTADADRRAAVQAAPESPAPEAVYADLERRHLA